MSGHFCMQQPSEQLQAYAWSRSFFTEFTFFLITWAKNSCATCLQTNPVCGQTHLVSRLGQSSRGRAVLGVAAYKAQVIKQAFWSRHFTVESLGATNFN
ncbi:hypothetical protein PC129_g3905 [Phytophthora cactorum]|uniref:Uncharacterized protein n=1 Tax=Phytophthora cactorum TaxID=29920 RepID=A0A8T1D1A3_9STRA|nr:hypothetical protein PC114_g6015 [Phytophthora cactorum]KAG2935143.1 hypothetical protein PC115_g4932 [Phytophthora cactorum]KAG3225499.1 hypothetical protein PC129_g3905 [Phytophthora cactorum]